MERVTGGPEGREGAQPIDADARGLGEEAHAPLVLLAELRAPPR